VGKAAGHLGFPDGPLAGDLLLGFGEVRRLDYFFHCHVVVEQFVAGLPDYTHFATADVGTEPVAPGEQTSRFSQLHVAAATRET